LNIKILPEELSVLLVNVGGHLPRIYSKLEQREPPSSCVARSMRVVLLVDFLDEIQPHFGIEREP
jgi:hypothetical protein